MEKIQDKILWLIVKIMAVCSVIMGVGLFVYFVFIYNPDDSQLEKRLKKMNAQIEQLQKQVDTLKIEHPKNANSLEVAND